MMDDRTKKGQFPKGTSGNLAGRPKGSKNKMTLLRQSLELQLREEAAPQMSDVLTQAMQLALAGDRSMIKLLLELHMTKGVADEREAKEKVSITIGTHESHTPKDIIINGEHQDAKAITSATRSGEDAVEFERDAVAGEQQTSERGPSREH
jgi:hypothetical protein